MAPRKRRVEESAATSRAPEPPLKRKKATRGRPPGKAAPKIASTATAPTILNTAPETRFDVFVFGEGSAGELGLGSKNAVDVKRPRLNAFLDAKTVGVVDIAAGGMHAVALSHGGDVLTWGVNDNFALGRETTWEGGFKEINGKNGDDDSASVDSEDIELNPCESTPTVIPMDKFPTGTKIVSVTAGDNASFVLTAEGLVYGWGTFISNEGKAGWRLNTKGEVTAKQSEPILLPELKNIVQISAGNNFCLALDIRGKVWSWGRYGQSQLGRRPVASRQKRHSPDETAVDMDDAGLHPGLVALPPRTKIVSIHAGSDHAFAIDSKGDTWAWGLNNYGQTGIRVGAGNRGTTVFVPQRVASLVGKKMKMIQGGSHHSIAITQNGDCLVWGRMDGSQMGIDVTTLPIDDPSVVVSELGKPRILLEPTRVPVSGTVYGAAGSDHNILITSDGKAYSWGFNANYQCGQGPDTDDITVATLIENTAVRDKKLTWAGAGGQYSMIAGYHQNQKNLENHKSQVVNGV